jgi:hypothetical protein
MSEETTAPIAARGEAERYVSREGLDHSQVRARSADASSRPLWPALHLIMSTWRRMIRIAGNPYRPELHYMRGPGPKWYAKHQRR